jgi:hypothetical protein
LIQHYSTEDLFRQMPDASHTPWFPDIGESGPRTRRTRCLGSRLHRRAHRAAQLEQEADAIKRAGGQAFETALAVDELNGQVQAAQAKREEAVLRQTAWAAFESALFTAAEETAA